MNKNLTELVYIMDESGSMYNLRDDTIGGYNQMIDEQKSAPGEARVTTVLFNHTHRRIVDNMDVREVPKIASKDYTPNSSTAMLDAIGDTVIEIGKKLADMPEHERPGKVIVTIITDGEENSSTEYTLKQIKDMIEEQRNKYSWMFVFIGANIDAMSVGSSIGIDRKLTKNYTASKVGTETLYKSLSNAMTNVRCCATTATTDDLSDIIDKELGNLETKVESFK